MGPGHVAAPLRAADTLWGSDAVPIYALDYAAPAIDPQAFVHPDAVVIGAVELGAGSRCGAIRCVEIRAKTLIA